MRQLGQLGAADDSGLLPVRARQDLEVAHVAGRSGEAILFIAPRERNLLRLLGEEDPGDPLLDERTEAMWRDGIVEEAARLAARRAAQRWSGKKPQTKVVMPR